MQSFMEFVLCCIYLMNSNGFQYSVVGGAGCISDHVFKSM